MQKLANILTSVNFLGLVAAAIYFLFFFEAPRQFGSTHTKEIIYYDSSDKSVPVVSAPGTVSFYPVVIPGAVDTAELRRAYQLFYSSYTYTQTIQDSSIRAKIFDSISENRVLNRRFNYQWIKPVKTVESTTITLPAPAKKPGLYMGLFLDYSGARVGFGPKLSFETKRNLMISADYEALNKGYRLSIQQRLNVKR